MSPNLSYGRRNRSVIVELTPKPPSPGAPAAVPPGESLLAAWLHVLADCGFGIWLWLGAAMALNLYTEGRGETLVPLLLGAIFVSLGLLLAGLRLPGTTHWHGWRWGESRRPTGRALLALATYLPMLAVAALARGDNDFWATRLAGLILALCSLACLASIHYVRQQAESDTARSALLPLSRVIAACYSGGLWLWACVMGQTAPAPLGWRLCLLSLALLLGLLESLHWQKLPTHSRAAAGPQTSGLRFVAVGLTYVLPCLLLLPAHFVRDNWWLAILAGISAVLGRSLEHWLFARVLMR